MSDTTEGWEDLSVYAMRKTIGRIKFTIDINIDLYSLCVGDNWLKVATRQTLRECQELAHATARLWAGDTE